MNAHCGHRSAGSDLYPAAGMDEDDWLDRREVGRRGAQATDRRGPVEGWRAAWRRLKLRTQFGPVAGSEDWWRERMTERAAVGT
ncbi:MAG: hypothetical protein ABWZ78_14475 [Burkholderiaceae bacterium]